MVPIYTPSTEIVGIDNALKLLADLEANHQVVLRGDLSIEGFDSKLDYTHESAQLM